MAYDKANMNCAAVGPQKLWIYYTVNSLSSSTLPTYFNQAKVPGLAANDFMLIKTLDQCDLLNITAATNSNISVVRALTNATYADHASQLA